MTDLLRSMSEQLKDEFSSMYKRMTDPEERRKHQLKEHRKQVALSVAIDAGL